MANTKITSNVIADNAITTAAIADDAITSAKLDTNIAVAGTLTTTGEITANGGIALGDDDKAVFGADSDLEIYHTATGNHSIIEETGGGNLVVRTNGSQIEFDKGSTEYMARMIPDGAVELYYDSALKLATTSTGIDVTGTATMDELTVDTSAGQLDIEALGGSSVKVKSSGSLKIEATGGAVDLIHGSTEVLSTTATGIDVTGTAEADNIYAGATGSQTLIVSFPNTTAYPNVSTYNFTLTAAQAPIGSRVIMGVLLSSGNSSGDQYGYLAQDQSKGGQVRCYIEGWYWTAAGSSIFKIDNNNDRAFTFTHATITATNVNDTRKVYYYGYIMDN